DLFLILKKIVHRKTKMINTPHGPFMAHGNYSLIKILLKKLYIFNQRLFLNRLYRLVIQVNPDQYRWIKAYGIDEEKIKYLPNGINEVTLRTIKTSRALTDYGLNRRFIISYTGRFEEYKGIQQVIKALPKLAKTKPTIRFVAMGREGGYLMHLKTLVKNLEVEIYVVFLENPSDITRDEILTASKIFVMPSRWEAFGISILEAMAKKCAVVSTRTEGGKFLIKNKDNGLLYDFEDVKTLTKHLELLSKDAKMINKFSKNNYELAHNYLWDKIVIDYQDAVFNIF
ncbi:MAG TPA: glycosyltransferase family 4 protein, partial [Candidatus Dojkabacteria bacterium]|nr:glycosyltransferase family 4 protein [Candidatus Dojkabacteria bacterium]